MDQQLGKAKDRDKWRQCIRALCATGREMDRRGGEV